MPPGRNCATSLTHSLCLVLSTPSSQASWASRDLPLFKSFLCEIQRDIYRNQRNMSISHPRTWTASRQAEWVRDRRLSHGRLEAWRNPECPSHATAGLVALPHRGRPDNAANRRSSPPPPQPGHQLVFSWLLQAGHPTFVRVLEGRSARHLLFLRFSPASVFLPVFPLVSLFAPSCEARYEYAVVRKLGRDRSHGLIIRTRPACCPGQQGHCSGSFVVVGRTNTN